MSETIELLQFRKSHYNEKARWSLDWKGVPHRRRSLLPGPHARTITKLTGQSMVPVVRFGDQMVAGSASIIDELERRYPDPPLYPADLEERARARQLQSWFDDEVGPMVRRGIFAVLLGEPGYLCTLFAGHCVLPKRLAYRASLPLVSGLIRTSMGITDAASIDQALAVTEKAFDFVAKEAGPDGHLVGDSFSVADLAGAALLAPAVDVTHPDMVKPRPMPRAVEEWLARWAKHPGAEWVRDRYRKYRPEPAAIAG